MPKTTTRQSTTKRPTVLAPKGNGVLKTVLPNGLTIVRHAGKLWIDTSVRDERIAPGGKLLPEWRALFLRYPDRFLVAVDTFSLNRWQHYEAVVGQIRAWTDPLPEPLKTNLLHDNAARLFADFLQAPTAAAQ